MLDIQNESVAFTEVGMITGPAAERIGLLRQLGSTIRTALVYCDDQPTAVLLEDALTQIRAMISRESY